MRTTLITLLVVPAVPAFAGPPLYQAEPMGLRGPNNCSTSGSCVQSPLSSYAREMCGYSDYILPGVIERGSEAWVQDNHGVRRLGYYDAVHTKPDGVWHSRISHSDGGVFSGYSYRYSTSTRGSTAWVYSQGETTRVGLFDAEHTPQGVEGMQWSSVDEVTDNGVVIGVSRRTNGTSIWTYQNGQTTRVGLWGPGFVRADGYALTEHLGHAQDGTVRGRSLAFLEQGGTGYRYWIAHNGVTYQPGLASSQLGVESAVGNQVDAVAEGVIAAGTSYYTGVLGETRRAAWVYRNGVTTRILGLRGPEHIDSAGEGSDIAKLVSTEGAVAGVTLRLGDNPSVSNAWVHVAGVTTPVGFTGPEFTTSTGRQDTTIMAIAPAGQTLGYSEPHSGPGDNWSAYWLFDGQVQHKVGPDIAPFNAIGFPALADSSVRLAPSGVVFGTAIHVVGSITQRTMSFVQRGADVEEIGITEPPYTRPDGSLWVKLSAYSPDGLQVTGTCEFSLPGVSAPGQSGFLYDSETGQTDRIVGGARADGWHFIVPQSVPAPGVIFGYYIKHEGMASLGERPFYWSREDGFHDINDLIVGGLDELGVPYIQRVAVGSGVGTTFEVIRGLPPSGSPPRSAYITLVPARCLSADYTRDGGVDVADIHLFFEAFTGAAIGVDADFNRDGGVDVGDIDAFFRVFSGGEC